MQTRTQPGTDMKTETYNTHGEALDRAIELELRGFEATIKQIRNAYIIEWRE